MGPDAAMQGMMGGLKRVAQSRKSRPAAPGGRDVGGLIRVVSAAGLMGTLGPIAAVAYAEGLSPPLLSALRAAIGGILLGLLLVARQQAFVDLRALPRRQLAMLGLAVVVNGVMNLALFLAFGAMAVGLVMLLYYAYPAIVAGLSAALGRERLTVARMLALVTAASGVALVLGGQLEPGANATIAGVALAGAAATCQAVYLLAIRGGFDDVPAVQATTLVLAGGVVISGGAAIALEGPALVGSWLASPIAWLAIACAGTFGALPKVWIIGGVRRIGSTAAAIAMLVEPLVAVVAAALLVGQRLSGLELAGGAAILVAVVLAQARPRAARRPAVVEAA
jgi:drug/metabolite transporter (DMT)-like permease